MDCLTLRLDSVRGDVGHRLAVAALVRVGIVMRDDVILGASSGRLVRFVS